MKSLKNLTGEALKREVRRVTQRLERQMASASTRVIYRTEKRTLYHGSRVDDRLNLRVLELAPNENANELYMRDVPYCERNCPDYEAFYRTTGRRLDDIALNADVTPTIRTIVEMMLERWRPEEAIETGDVISDERNRLLLEEMGSALGKYLLSAGYKPINSSEYTTLFHNNEK